MKKIYLTFQYIILIFVSFLFVFPLYFVLCKASGGNTAINEGLILPGNELWNNILFILNETEFLPNFVYTLGYTTTQTFVTLCICALAGYGFEIYHDKIKDAVFQIILLTLMVPFTALIVPLFIMFSEVHLQNTTIAMVMPFLASPLIIMMFRQHSRSFPHELIEAARIDGLSDFFIFLFLYVPNMKATFACGAIIAFLNAWNSYQWPRVIMIAQEYVPMTVYLTMGDTGNRMTLILLSMLPTFIVFFTLQKFFVKGMQGALQ